jgi:citrate lyase subunit beta/citryl-CoA lyase
MAVMRSVFYIPANNDKMISKAPKTPADIITLDLEDSVPPAEKPKSREMIKKNLKIAGSGGSLVYVRINNWFTPWTDDDIEASVHEGLAGLCLPKCAGPDHVKRLEWKIEELERRRGLPIGSVAIQLLAETAIGVINAYPSAVASKRVNSIIFGAVDYCKDMRVKLTLCIAIDCPFVAYQDLALFEKTTSFGHQLGYEGRMLIHPSQIEPAHRIYTPSAEDVALAAEIVKVFEEEGIARGLAAINHKGQMVDTPVYESARATLATMEEITAFDKKRKKS